MNGFAIDVLKRFAWASPTIAIAAIVILICYKNRAKKPRFSKLVSWAFILFAAHSVFGVLNRTWFISTALEPHTLSSIELGIYYGITSASLAFIDFIGWVLLLLGIRDAFDSHPFPTTNT